MHVKLQAWALAPHHGHSMFLLPMLLALGPVCSQALRTLLFSTQGYIDEMAQSVEGVYDPYMSHISSNLHVLPHVILIDLQGPDQPFLEVLPSLSLWALCTIIGFPLDFLMTYCHCPSRLLFLPLNNSSTLIIWFSLKSTNGMGS